MQAEAPVADGARKRAVAALDRLSDILGLIDQAKQKAVDDFDACLDKEVGKSRKAFEAKVKDVEDKIKSWAPPAVAGLGELKERALAEVAKAKALLARAHAEAD